MFRNQVVDNDTPNFAPPGNIVASVPTGTGILMMANRNVHVFENTIDENETAHVMVVRYSHEFEDANYNPLPRDIVDPRQHLWRRRQRSAGQAVRRSAPALGGKLPPIVWDGVTKYGEKGDKTEEVRIAVREKPEVGFINLGLGDHAAGPDQGQAVGQSACRMRRSRSPPRWCCPKRSRARRRVESLRAAE